MIQIDSNSTAYYQTLDYMQYKNNAIIWTDCTNISFYSYDFDIFEIQYTWVNSVQLFLDVSEK